MYANATKLGQCFYKLVQAHESDLCEDVANYDTTLLEHYVIAVDEHDDYVSCTASELGEFTLQTVNTVTVVGGRCYAKTVTAYTDAVDNLWIDAELHDELFC